jgi:hypothetical protein
MATVQGPEEPPRQSSLTRNPWRVAVVILLGVVFVFLFLAFHWFSGLSGGVDPADVVVTGSRAPESSVHTARLESEHGLTGNRVRVNVRSKLTYVLKPPSEVAEGELAEPASTPFLRALAEGGNINVKFSCSHCDEADRNQAPIALKVDESVRAASGELRSLPMSFSFIPRAASAVISRLEIKPYVALTFTMDGYDLDRWVIPIAILAEGAQAEGPSKPLTRGFAKVDSELLHGEEIVKLAYRLGGNDPELRITAPANYGLSLLPLAQAPGVTKIAHTPKSVEYSLKILRSEGQVRSAGNTLQAYLNRAIANMAGFTAASETSRCSTAPDGIVNQSRTSDALEACLRSHRYNLATAMFPESIARTLFNLARCVDPSIGDEHPPVLVITGLPYAPYQFLPVDPESARGQCSPGLLGRKAEVSWPSQPSDNFLGLLVPMVVVPNEFGSILSPDTGSQKPSEATDPVDVLAGVYRELHPTGDGQGDEYGFEQFASLALQKEAVITRDSTSFVTRLLDARNDVRTILINTHGLRGERSAATAVSQSDMLVFSHWNSLAGDPLADVPDEARLLADDLMKKFQALMDTSATYPLSARPAVVLLACDTAPYKPDATTLGYPFLFAGASAVVATETQVSANVARLFGQIYMEFSDEGAAMAAYLSRRKAFQENRTVLPLLWAVVSVDGAVN